MKSWIILSAFIAISAGQTDVSSCPSDKPYVFSSNKLCCSGDIELASGKSSCSNGTNKRYLDPYYSNCCDGASAPCSSPRCVRYGAPTVGMDSSTTTVTDYTKDSTSYYVGNIDTKKVYEITAWWNDKSTKGILSYIFLKDDTTNFFRIDFVPGKTFSMTGTSSKGITSTVKAITAPTLTRDTEFTLKMKYEYGGYMSVWVNDVVVDCIFFVDGNAYQKDYLANLKVSSSLAAASYMVRSVKVYNLDVDDTLLFGDMISIKGYFTKVTGTNEVVNVLIFKGSATYDKVIKIMFDFGTSASVTAKVWGDSLYGATTTKKLQDSFKKDEPIEVTLYFAAESWEIYVNNYNVLNVTHQFDYSDVHMEFERPADFSVNSAEIIHRSATTGISDCYESKSISQATTLATVSSISNLYQCVAKCKATKGCTLAYLKNGECELIKSWVYEAYSSSYTMVSMECLEKVDARSRSESFRKSVESGENSSLAVDSSPIEQLYDGSWYTGYVITDGSSTEWYKLNLDHNKLITYVTIVMDGTTSGVGIKVSLFDEFDEYVKKCGSVSATDDKLGSKTQRTLNVTCADKPGSGVYARIILIENSASSLDMRVVEITPYGINCGRGSYIKDNKECASCPSGKVNTVYSSASSECSSCNDGYYSVNWGTRCRYVEMVTSTVQTLKSLVGASMTFTCTWSGVDENNNNNPSWTTSGVLNLKSAGNTVTIGLLNKSSRRQTSTFTLKSSNNIEDKIYTCTWTDKNKLVSKSGIVVVDTFSIVKAGNSSGIFGHSVRIACTTSGTADTITATTGASSVDVKLTAFGETTNGDIGQNFDVGTQTIYATTSKISSGLASYIEAKYDCEYIFDGTKYSQEFNFDVILPNMEAISISSVKSSSVYKAIYADTNINDGNIGTMWHSLTGKQWIQLHFGQWDYVGMVLIIGRQDGYWTRMTGTQVTIHFSNDTKIHSCARLQARTTLPGQTFYVDCDGFGANYLQLSNNDVMTLAEVVVYRRTGPRWHKINDYNTLDIYPSITLGDTIVLHGIWSDSKTVIDLKFDTQETAGPGITMRLKYDHSSKQFTKIGVGTISPRSTTLFDNIKDGDSFVLELIPKFYSWYIYVNGAGQELKVKPVVSSLASITVVYNVVSDDSMIITSMEFLSTAHCYLARWTKDGGTLRIISNVNSAYECVLKCAELENCKSISYKLSTKACRLKNEEMVEGIAINSAYIYVRMSCMDKHVSIEKDKPVTLTCSFGNVPSKAKITWEDEYGAEMSSNEEYHIKDADVWDFKNRQQTSHLIIKSAQTKRFACVLYPADGPSVRLVKSVLAYDVVTSSAPVGSGGSNAFFKCIATGLQRSVKMTWKNGDGTDLLKSRELSTSGGIDVNSDGAKSELNKNFYQAIMLTVSGSGNEVKDRDFKCIANMNDANTVTISQSLDKFDISSTSPLRLELDSEVRFTCTFLSLTTTMTYDDFSWNLAGIDELKSGSWDPPKLISPLFKAKTVSGLTCGLNSYSKTIDIKAYKMEGVGTMMEMSAAGTELACITNVKLNTADVKWNGPQMSGATQDRATVNGIDFAALDIGPMTTPNDAVYTCKYIVNTKTITSSTVTIDVIEISIANPIITSDGFTLTCTVLYADTVIPYEGNMKWTKDGNVMSDSEWNSPHLTLAVAKDNSVSDDIYTCVFNNKHEKTVTVDRFIFTGMKDVRVMKTDGQSESVDLECTLTNLAAAIDSSTDVKWTNGDDDHTASSTYNPSTGVTTLTVSYANINTDTTYTCCVRILDVWHSALINIDYFEIRTTVSQSVVKVGEPYTLVCDVFGINLLLDSTNLGWKIDGTAANTALLSQDHNKLQLETTAASNTDVVYECVVDSKWTKTVNVDVFDMKVSDVTKAKGSTLTVTCKIDGYKGVITDDMFDWGTGTDGKMKSTTINKINSIYKLEITEDVEQVVHTYFRPGNTWFQTQFTVGLFYVTAEVIEVEKGGTAALKATVYGVGTGSVTIEWHLGRAKLNLVHLEMVVSGVLTIEASYGPISSDTDITLTTVHSEGRSISTTITIDAFEIIAPVQGFQKGEEGTVSCKVEGLKRELTVYDVYWTYSTFTSDTHQWDGSYSTSPKLIVNGNKAVTCGFKAAGDTSKTFTVYYFDVVTEEPITLYNAKPTVAVTVLLTNYLVSAKPAKSDWTVTYASGSAITFKQKDSSSGRDTQVFIQPDEVFTSERTYDVSVHIYDKTYTYQLKHKVIDIVPYDMTRLSGIRTTLTCKVLPWSVHISPSSLAWALASGTKLTGGQWDDPYWTLDIGAVTTDGTYTCSYSTLHKTVSVDMFDIIDSRDTHVLAGNSLILTCLFSDLLTSKISRDNLRWTSGEKDYNDKAQFTMNPSGAHKYKLILGADDVQKDMEFSCSIYLDGEWHSKTVNVDFFEISLTASDDMVPVGELLNLTCTLVGLDTIIGTDNIYWSKGNSALTGGIQENPHFIQEVTAAATDTTYRCNVKYSGKVQYKSITIDVFNFALKNRVKLVRADIKISCGVTDLGYSLTQDMIKWTTQKRGMTEDIYGKEYTVEAWDSVNRLLTKTITRDEDQYFTCHIKTDNTWWSKTMLVDVFDIVGHPDISFVYGRVPSYTNNCTVIGLRQSITINDNRLWKYASGSTTYQKKASDSKVSWNGTMLQISQSLTDYDHDKIYTCQFIIDNHYFTKQYNFDIIESCKVVKTNVNSVTNLDTDEDWVIDGTVVSITCDQGYILDAGESYSHTCNIKAPKIHTSFTPGGCHVGCWITDPVYQLDKGFSIWAGMTNYLGMRRFKTTYSYKDTYNLAGSTYHTVHHDGTIYIACGDGYTLLSDWTKSRVCPRRSMRELVFNGLCVIGCKVTWNDFTTYKGYTPAHNMIDKQNLLAQKDSIKYYCEDRTWTALGKQDYTFICKDGTPAALNECKNVAIAAPAIHANVGSVKITLAQPSHPSVKPSKYTIRLFENQNLIMSSTVSDGYLTAFDGLTNNTQYKISYTMTFAAGDHEIRTNYSFTTLQLDLEHAYDDHHALLDVPQADFAISSYELIALYKDNNYNDDYDLTEEYYVFNYVGTGSNTSNSVRKRGITKYEETAKSPVYVKIYSSAYYMLKSKDIIAGFLVTTIQASEIGSASTYEVETERLHLKKKDHKFELFLRACKTSARNSCFDGATTTIIDESHIERTLLMAILIPIVLIILLIAMNFCYKGKCPRIKSYSRKESRYDVRATGPRAGNIYGRGQGLGGVHVNPIVIEKSLKMEVKEEKEEDNQSGEGSSKDGGSFTTKI